MAVLSKSKLIAFRQCPRRLWLEVHQPQLREDSPATQAAFVTGHRVGDVARHAYDPCGAGTTVDLQALGVAGAIAATRELVARRRPIFEAGFQVQRGGRGTRAFADVLLPLRPAGAWRMVEVKSSTSVKDYHRDDVAIQYHIATRAGLDVRKVHLACVDSSWTYPGGGDYGGLLKEYDLTEEAAGQQARVRGWIREAHAVVECQRAPDVRMGPQCIQPFACGFEAHCRREDERRHGKVLYPIQWLPGGGSKALKSHLQERAPRSLRQVPEGLLNVQQLRVKTHSLRDCVYFDAQGAASELAVHELPALFLDFETISFAVPVWAGTRPYEQVPFQFSLHRLGPDGALSHSGLLDLSGQDPSERIARALVASCGRREPVFTFNKSFEGKRLEVLAGRFTALAARLLAIRDRLVDLHPIATRHYYHPGQQGSWSIKAILPTIAPELDYGDLDGVQDGGAAQAAYLEAIQPATAPERREQLRQQLRRYCRLDTFALVRLWSHFVGRLQRATRHDRAASVEARP